MTSTPTRTTAVLTLACALLALLLAACGSDDAIPEHTGPRVGQIPAGDLRVGECIEGPVEGNPDRGRAALCSDTVAIYRVSERFEATGDAYPGENAIRTEADSTCGAAVLVLFPTEERWATGDRTVVCFEAK